METILIVIAVWFALSIPVGILVGKIFKEGGSTE